MAPLRTGDGFPDVVVTAVASTTSLAPDAETTWQLLLEGQSGIRHLDKPFVGEFKSPVRIGGPLQESFDEHLSRVELRRLSFMQKMSLLLGRRLWESAGSPEIDTRRLMISIGLALGSTEEIPVQYDAWKEKGLRAVSPLAVQMYMPNAPAAAVGLDREAKAGIISPVMADASIPAAPSSWSATSITAPVPPGATSGPVVVTVAEQREQRHQLHGLRPGDLAAGAVSRQWKRYLQRGCERRGGLCVDGAVCDEWCDSVAGACFASRVWGRPDCDGEQHVRTSSLPDTYRWPDLLGLSSGRQRGDL